MRIADIVKVIKDRQLAMQEAVFKRPNFTDVDFAKEQGRWLGLSEAITIISDEMRKEIED